SASRWGRLRAFPALESSAVFDVRAPLSAARFWLLPLLALGIGCATQHAAPPTTADAATSEPPPEAVVSPEAIAAEYAELSQSPSATRYRVELADKELELDAGGAAI